MDTSPAADPPELEISRADLNLPEHQQAVLALIEAYAMDPMGNGKRLNEDVRNRLIPALQQHPTTQILLGWADGKPVAIAVCFLGFSTFAAKPVLNIHDLAILPEWRGRGIGRRMLQAVERLGASLECCKVTLEVWEYNDRGRALYAACGFCNPSGSDAEGATYFLTRNI